MPETTHVTWGSNLETDLLLVDREHQAIVAGLNRLLTRIDAGESVAAWLADFDTLVSEVAKHFEHEERVMENVGYRHYVPHKRQHEQLLQEVGQFRERLGAADPELNATAIVRFLRYWVLRHVVQEDLQIKQHIYRGLT